MYAVPAWVVPSPERVMEMQEVVFQRYTDTQLEWVRGAANVLLWVLWGSLRGPVTGRPEQPVTAEMAEAEWWVAAAVVEPPGIPALALEEICAQLGVAYFPPGVGCTRSVARGVWPMLGWLLGMEEAGSPDGLPSVWRRQGRTPSAEELYDKEIAVGQDRYRLPEAQIALWRRVRRDAARYRRVVARIEDAKRRLRVV